MLASRVLAVALLSSCAPAYHPAAVHAPVFDGPGQISAVALASESGLHLAAAYAPVDHLAIRVRGQTRPFADGEQYWVAGGGAEGFWILNETARFSAGAEVAVGRVDSFDSFTILSETTNLSSTGGLLQVAVPMTVGWKLGAVTTGVQVRLVAHTLFNDLQWTGQTRGTLGIFEGHGFFRVGGVVAFESQAGMSIPVLREGDVARGYFPLHVGIGLAVQLDLKKNQAF